MAELSEALDSLLDEASQKGFLEPTTHDTLMRRQMGLPRNPALMDSDISKDLKKVGKHLHDLSRQIESPNITVEKLEHMAELFEMSVATMRTYARVQKMRRKHG